MRFLTIFEYALAVGFVTASELEPRVTTTSLACPYPAIQTSILSCRTGAAFCSSFLGRGPTTTSITVDTYTTTRPAKTVTYQLISSATSRVTTTFPTRTITSTTIYCPSGGATRAAPPLPDPTPNVAVAIGPSCGVARFSSAWISNACQCDYDSTTYIASTTKTRKAGTTLVETLSTRTTTISSIFWRTTTTITTTATNYNCPPANASCATPAMCGYYYSYPCGSNNNYYCYCGIDYFGRGICMYGYPYCDTTCVRDSDCATGSFCVYDSCCSSPTCMPADVCIGDQGTTTIDRTSTSSNFRALPRTAAADWGE